MTAVCYRLPCLRIKCPYVSRVLGEYGRIMMSSVPRKQADNVLEAYTAPEWAKCLSNVPQYKTKLAMLNTPVERWDLPGVPDDFQVYIKRDDMTGGTLSGNKVRKLEFIFADAIQKRCRHLITCGSLQSNYCRAAAIAATQLGLKTHLVLRSEAQTVEEAGFQANVFLDRLCGANIYLAPKKAAYETELLPRMRQISEHIRQTTGGESYLSRVGGSDAVGFYGYLEAFRELLGQGITDYIDDIVNTTGSGGTSEGLAAGNYLTGSNFKVHGIAVSDDAPAFHQHAAATFEEVGLKGVRSEDILDVIDGHKGGGYGVASSQDYEFIRSVAERTGIVLDPTYTAKAARGLVEELRTNPDRFKGRRILFIHTGGVFGAFDGRLESAMQQESSINDNIHLWKHLEQRPF